MITGSLHVSSLSLLRRSLYSQRKRVILNYYTIDTSQKSTNQARLVSCCFFDPSTIRKGIAWERDRGFVNALGKGTVNFQEFLVRNLETFSEQVKASSIETKLKICQLRAQEYDVLEAAEREKLCEEVLVMLSVAAGVESVSISNRPSKPIIKTADPCMEPMADYALIGIDFETNGFSGIGRYQVVEIGAMNFASGNVFHSLIHPGNNVTWNKSAEQTHGITKQMVVNDDVWSWSVVWNRFVEWVREESNNKRVVLVAHNGMGFDFQIMMHKTNGVVDHDWSFFDSCIYARHLRRQDLLIGNVNLETLRKTFNVDTYGNAHQADVDIVDLGSIFKGLLSIGGATTEEHLAEMMSGDCPWCQSYSGVLEKMQQHRHETTIQSAMQPRSPMKKDIVGNDIAAKMEKDIKEFLKEPYDGRLTEWLCRDVANLGLYTPTMRKKLKESGFATLLNILKHLPREYVSLTDPTTLKQNEGSLLLFKGTVTSAKLSVGTMNLISWTLRVEHETHPLTVKATQFLGRSRIGTFVANKKLKDFPIGSEAILVGKLLQFNRVLGRCDLSLNQMLPADELGDSPVLPIYPVRKKITAEQFRSIISKAVKLLEPLCSIDIYPANLRQKYKITNWLVALFALHRPLSLEALEKAKAAVIFHDLLCMHALLTCRSDQQALLDIYESYTIQDHGKIEIVEKAFGHKLTADQRKCLDEILADMADIRPMVRILQGDVGTGKTIVALMAMFAVYGSGLQSAMVVPTEILGQQHFTTLRDLVQNCPGDSRPRIAILTAMTKPAEKKSLLNDLSNGDIDMLIGTHALFQKAVQFHRLGLVVVDEQHKFGVEQRRRINQSSSAKPHLLMMSATPIPRSMALAIYGTMSVSSIKTALPGKKEVKTYIVEETDTRAIDMMYENAKKDIRTGGRVYIVYPFIRESVAEALSHLKAATTEYERLSTTRFAEFSCGLVHGQMSPQEKNAAFTKFVNGKTKVLISTTVIEIGVDVQEASIMIVFHPERYGLATLHQLRGRVGRGRRDSICYLVPSKHVERLEVLKKSADGEAIARADLQHRGPGDLVGYIQSGFKSCMTFPWNEMFANPEIISTAKNAAEEFVQLSGGDIPKEFEEMMRIQGFPELDDVDV